MCASAPVHPVRACGAHAPARAHVTARSILDTLLSVSLFASVFMGRSIRIRVYGSVYSHPCLWVGLFASVFMGRSIRIRVHGSVCSLSCLMSVGLFKYVRDVSTYAGRKCFLGKLQTKRN
uniref:Uncharacterized protein n=1 Tax=Setaria digitata TaxID=48799 RepID=A0A915PN55_9BILA